MANYDLSSPAAIAAAAKEVEAERQKLHNDGDRTGIYDTRRTAFLYAYGQALQDCANQLDRFQSLVNIVLNYLGEHNDSSKLYDMFHEGMELSDDEIEFLGFDLPQLSEEDKPSLGSQIHAASSRTGPHNPPSKEMTRECLTPRPDTAFIANLI